MRATAQIYLMDIVAGKILLANRLQSLYEPFHENKLMTVMAELEARVNAPMDHSEVLRQEMPATSAEGHFWGTKLGSNSKRLAHPREY
jgi:hypothetical protein